MIFENITDRCDRVQPIRTSTESRTTLRRHALNELFAGESAAFRIILINWKTIAQKSTTGRFAMNRTSDPSCPGSLFKRVIFVLYWGPWEKSLAFVLFFAVPEVATGEYRHDAIIPVQNSALVIHLWSYSTTLSMTSSYSTIQLAEYYDNSRSVKPLKIEFESNLSRHCWYYFKPWHYKFMSEDRRFRFISCRKCWVACDGYQLCVGVGPAKQRAQPCSKRKSSVQFSSGWLIIKLDKQWNREFLRNIDMLWPQLD